MLKKIKKYINVQITEQREFFNSGKYDIAAQNLKTLIQMSILVTILICIFLLVTPLIITNWKPSIQHLLFSPVMLIFCAWAVYYKKKQKINSTVVNLACILFVAFLFSFVIFVDVFPNTDEPSTFMQAALIAVPALFIIKFPILYVEILFFETIFIASTYVSKTDVVAAHDLFNSMVGVLVSFSLSGIIHSLHAKSYNAKNQYMQLSMRDGLTGILNKVNCEQAVRRYLKTRRRNERCAFMILDIDNFKRINDTMGHKTGDEVLEKLSSLLLKSFKNQDLLGRFGGDEFLILVKDVPNEAASENICKRVLRSIRELREELGYDVTCSIGAAFLEGGVYEYEKIFNIADDALYKVKSSGKAGYILQRVRC